MKINNIVLLTTLSFLLAACGGGGSSAVSSGPLSLPVTVATGAPVEGAAVTVVDATGVSETCEQLSAADGTLNCQLRNAKTAPFFIKAQKLSNTLYAVLPENAARANITPVSNAMAKAFADRNNATPEQLIGLPATMAATDKASAQAAVDMVNAVVQAVAQQTASLTIGNALTQPFTAVQTDPLDKLIHNMSVVTDSSGITLMIPTTAGAVNVNTRFDAAPTQARAAAEEVTRGVTANLSDGAAIDVLLDGFFARLSSCEAADQAAIVNMIVARDHAGVQYAEGRTVAGWVAQICRFVQGGSLTRTYSKSLARVGNQAFYQFGIKTSSSEFEIVMALKKVNGNWKLMSDNMPINFALKTRHALEYNIDGVTGSPTVKYSRYLDTWVDPAVAIPGAQPDRVEIYAFPMKDAAAGLASLASNNTSRVSPDVTVYRKPNGSTCASTEYTITSNRSECEIFAQDARHASLFAKLQNNQYVLVAYKNLDASGNCLNCDAAGIPESGTVLGQAYSTAQLFGSSVSAIEAQLRGPGVALADLYSSFMTNARVFYAAPSANDLNSLSRTLSSAQLLDGSITIPWLRATKDRRQVDGLWAGYVPCASSVWTSFEDAATLNRVEDFWTFTMPGAQSLGSASFLQFTIANRLNESEFAFYVNVQRSQRCAPT